MNVVDAFMCGTLDRYLESIVVVYSFLTSFFFYFHKIHLGFHPQFRMKENFYFFSCVFLTTEIHQHFSYTALEILKDLSPSLCHTHKLSLCFLPCNFRLLKSNHSSRLPDCANLLKYVYHHTNLWSRGVFD